MREKLKKRFVNVKGKRRGEGSLKYSKEKERILIREIVYKLMNECINLKPMKDDFFRLEERMIEMNPNLSSKGLYRKLMKRYWNLNANIRVVEKII